MMKCSHIPKRIFQFLALKQSLAGVWSRHLEGEIDSTVTVMLVAMSCFLVERETGINSDTDSMIKSISIHKSNCGAITTGPVSPFSTHFSHTHGLHGVAKQSQHLANDCGTHTD